MLAHLRLFLPFYFLMLGIINLLATRYVKHIPWGVVMCMVLIQVAAVVRSMAYSLERGSEALGFAMAVFHIIVFGIALEGLVYHGIR